MFQNDYVMRQIGMLSRALARILRLKEGDKTAEALAEISLTGKQLLGIDMQLVHSLDAEALPGLLKAGGEPDVAKCLVLAELLKTEGDFQPPEHSGPEASRQSHIKSLLLFLEAFLATNTFQFPEHRQRIETLGNALRNHALPSALQWRLFGYYEATGSFGRAEDALFLLAGQAFPEVLAAGEAFYDRLSAKDDAELSAGNLPREELREGRLALRELLMPASK